MAGERGLRTRPSSLASLVLVLGLCLHLHLGSRLGLCLSSLGWHLAYPLSLGGLGLASCCGLGLALAGSCRLRIPGLAATAYPGKK